MEQFIYALFYGLTRLLLFLIGLPFAILAERQTPSSPLSLPLEPRLEHTHIVAGSGHGKTQLLQHMIITHDLAEGTTHTTAPASLTSISGLADAAGAASRTGMASVTIGTKAGSAAWPPCIVLRCVTPSLCRHR